MQAMAYTGIRPNLHRVDTAQVSALGVYWTVNNCAHVRLDVKHTRTHTCHLRVPTPAGRSQAWRNRGCELTVVKGCSTK